MTHPVDVVVLISANAEWQPVRARYHDAVGGASPYGEWFAATLTTPNHDWSAVFLHGGWGKIDAAGSAQYALDRWRPGLLVNLGTCGGFAGDVSPGEVILADFTLVYDILEQMGDPDEALAHYATELDLSWLGRSPISVRRELMLSADRDIVAAEVDSLRARFGAIAADWESGAIAHVAARNGARCLILRAVTDVVDHETGEAYGRPELFVTRTAEVMARLLDSLPGWLAGIKIETTDYTD